MKMPTPDDVLADFLALETNYSGRNAALSAYDDFFNGNHWVEDEGGSADFQLTANYCRAVVQKYAAVLAKSPRFRIKLDGATSEQQVAAKKREAFVRAIWQVIYPIWRDVELNASKKKFGVLQAIWNAEEKPKDGKYVKWPFKFRSIKPEDFYPVYRTFDGADDFLYVYRYDPGRLVDDIEDTYGVSLAPTNLDEATLEETCDLIEYWDKDNYLLIARTTISRQTGHRGEINSEYGVVTLRSGKHSYGRVPFFVLQNLRNPDDDPTYLGSLGDIDSISGLNKHFNQMLSEAASEIVTNIHRPLVYASPDHTQDPAEIAFKPGAVIPIADTETLESLEWTGMPQAVENHIQLIIQAIQDLSFVGQSGFGQYPSGASGVGLRIILQSMEQILALKIPVRQDLLQELFAFLFQVLENKLAVKESQPTLIDEGNGTAAVTQFRKPEGAQLSLWIKQKTGAFGKFTMSAKDIDGMYDLAIDYGNLLPRNEAEFQQNEVYKLKAGSQSLWTTLDNLGVEDPDAEIERIKKEYQDPVLNTERVLMLKQLSEAAQAAPVPAGASPQGPVAGGPSKPAAPPVPAMPGQPEGQSNGGPAAPFFQRGPGQGPNLGQIAPPAMKPGINNGERRG